MHIHPQVCPEIGLFSSPSFQRFSCDLYTWDVFQGIVQNEGPWSLSQRPLPTVFSLGSTRGRAHWVLETQEGRGPAVLSPSVEGSVP